MNEEPSRPASSAAPEESPSHGLEHALARGPGADEAGLETEQMRGAIAERLFDARPAPIELGRFVVLETIGRGAMGTVMAAYDPQLDRRVAVKVLHGVPDEADRDRLLREAKALARLNHPNVVTVYEAGLSGGHVYMAMEFVDGGTLRELFAGLPVAGRGHDRRIPILFAEAAQGLRAAHRVGLVHRDLKPANMLLGRDGRLRIADFGLARVERQDTEDDADDVKVEGDPSTTGEPQAASHRVRWIGTPAYMAPEQFDGRADERSDQFNLCASFWEAVYGVPPYAGATVSATCGNVIEGRLQPVPPRADAPAWLRRILLRGLSVDPAARFADVAALLAELERRRRGSRSWWLLGGLAIGASAAGLLVSGDEEDVTARCTAEAQDRAPVWDGPLQSQARAAFEATGLGFAPAAFEHLDLRLTRWQDAWKDADLDACRAVTDPDGATRSQAIHQRGCLDRAAVGFAALVDAVAHADRDVVQRAQVAAHSLPSPSRCTAEGAERVLADASPTLAAAGAELSRAIVERGLRRVDAAQARLERLLPQLPDDDSAGLRTYVHGELATLASLRGDNDTLIERAREALADAELAGDTEAQIQAWRVMAIASARKGLTDDARFQISRIDSLARRDDVSDIVRARAIWGTAAALTTAKAWAESLPRFERALELFERDQPEDSQLASLRCDYSEALFVEEHLDGAIAQATRCKDAQIDRLGPEHPFVAIAWLTLSQYLLWGGEPARAIEHAERGREILDANPWFSPPHRAYARKLLGNARQQLGDPEGALADLGAGLELAIESGGPDDINAALIRSDMSISLGELHRVDEARTQLEEAIASADRNPAIIDSGAGTPRLNLASLLAERGEIEAALEHLQRARTILDDVRPATSSLSPTYWTTVAQVYRLCQRLDAAREVLDRALDASERARVGPAVKGRVLAEDARLREAMGDRAGADASLAAARRALADAGEAGRRGEAELDEWERARATSP